MSGGLSFRLFAHSWISDWNHGNAHFLRGLASELINRGHEVRCYEERDAWSIRNLAEETTHAAAQAMSDFRRAFPKLDVRPYSNDAKLKEFLSHELRGADVVIVHEWNAPEIVANVLSLKQQLGFRALFHDTHHRAYTNPREVLRFPLSEFDGVLAFGEAIRKIYFEAFGVKRVWTFHEAADTARFFPHDEPKDTDVVWIGNWGDEERTRELQEFLITPASALRDYRFAVHGVR
ncbi:MAG TPA: glycosyltransferase, partial [Terriglobales bacterium]|nr:glycosyltransferase [Terriglobales bacterium]